MALEADRDLKQPGGAAFWIGVAVGWAVIAYGIVGAVHNARDTHPRSLAIWIIGSLAVHDLVIAPLVFLTGGVLRRVSAASVRGPVQFALVVSGALAIISIPVVGGFGMIADNPSALPRNYAAGALIAFGVVWVGCIVALVVAWRRHRSAP